MRSSIADNNASRRDRRGALERSLKTFTITVYTIYTRLSRAVRAIDRRRFRPDFSLITYWNIGALRKSPMLGERDVCSYEVNEIFFPLFNATLIACAMINCLKLRAIDHRNFNGTRYMLTPRATRKYA